MSMTCLFLMLRISHSQNWSYSPLKRKNMFFIFFTEVKPGKRKNIDPEMSMMNYFSKLQKFVLHLHLPNKLLLKCFFFFQKKSNQKNEKIKESKKLNWIVFNEEFDFREATRELKLLSIERLLAANNQIKRKMNQAAKITNTNPVLPKRNSGTTLQKMLQIFRGPHLLHFFVKTLKKKLKQEWRWKTNSKKEFSN